MARADFDAPRSRRHAVQALAAAAGSALLLRASDGVARLQALAQDEDDDSSGRGRGRGCGRGGDQDNRGPGNAEDGAKAPAAEVPPGAIEVRIVSDDAGGFVPGEVAIDAGQAVTFVNAHGDEHTATGAGFDTGIIPEGGSATVLLEEPGVYRYACQIHPVMTGSITVRGADGEVPQPAAVTRGAPESGGASVRIANLAFDPSVVTMPAGATVTWTNDDNLPHTVTALDGQFDSGILDPGATFSWTFETPGSFAYQCQLHPTMQGTVTVDGSPAAAATPAAGEAEAAGSLTTGAGGLEGVWLVEFFPDDTVLIGPHQGLLTLHPDGLAHVDFALLPEDSSPETAFNVGHGEWSAVGDRVALALIALVTDARGRFRGTATIAAQGQPTEDGTLEGTFVFALATPTDESVGDGLGTWRGERVPLDRLAS
jgi:plastocyanin